MPKFGKVLTATVSGQKQEITVIIFFVCSVKFIINLELNCGMLNKNITKLTIITSTRKYRNYKLNCCPFMVKRKTFAEHCLIFMKIFEVFLYSFASTTI